MIESLGTGGAERSLVDLLPELRSAGIEPEVAVLHDAEPSLEPELRARGFTVHHVGGAGLLATTRALLALVRTHPVDLVHTTLFPADVAGRIAAAVAGIPAATSIVNTSYDPARLSDPNVRAWRLQVVRLVDAATARVGRVRVHAITGAVRDAAVRDLHLPTGRIEVIPRGRDPERLGQPGPDRRAEVRRRLGIPVEATVAVHVGRHEHQKAHDVLLDAAAPLLRDRSELHLLLCGREGNATPGIRRRLEGLPPDRVRVLGHVEDLPDILCASDVLVFPSRFEGLGGAVIEAMALGVPVVASDLPVLREVLGSTAAGWAPVDDARALQAAIEAVLADPHVASEAARHARARFRARFDHAAVAAAMVGFLERAASERPRSALRVLAPLAGPRRRAQRSDGPV